MQPPTAEQMRQASQQQEGQAGSIASRSRNQQPIRINADDESKCVLCLYALTIILPLFVALIIVIFVIPNATQQLNQSSYLSGTSLVNCQGKLSRQNSSNYLACQNNLTASSNTAGMYVSQLQNLNQFLLFYLDLSPYANSQANNQETLSESIILTVWLANYDSRTSQIQAVTSIHVSNISFSRSIHNLKKNRIFLGFQTKITSSDQFYWEITFQNNSVISTTSDFNLQTETIKPSFTIYTILLRVAFFVVALAIFIKYTEKIFKIPKGRESIQQKVVHFLSGLTLTFNDQVYFITVLWPNPFTSFLSALFIWNYFFALFVLWASFLLRIYYSEPDTETFQTKKPYRVVLFVLFYLCGLAFSTGFAILQTDDHPTISPTSINSPGFTFLLVITIIGFILGVLYLLYLFIVVCRDKPLLAYRNSVFMNISMFFFVGVVIILILGSFQVFNYSAALIMFTFAVANLYSYLLQYLYAPTEEQLQRFGDGQNESNSRRLVNDPDVETIDIDLTLLDDHDEEKSNKHQSSQHSQHSNHSHQSKGSIRSQRRRLKQEQKHSEQERIPHKQFQGETKDQIAQQDPPLLEQMSMDLEQELK